MNPVSRYKFYINIMGRVQINVNILFESQKNDPKGH